MLATVLVGSTAGYLILQPAGEPIGAGGWLTGWQYRKSHIINPVSGAGTNYQIKITVYYGSGFDSGGTVYLNSHCKSDFGDVCFTRSDGSALLDYWMESYTASTSAIFWVEVIDDLSTVGRTIYVYYGNPSATTTSNGDNTFMFFDDFSAGVLNPTKWSVETISTGDGTYYNMVNGELHIYAASADPPRGFIFRSNSGFSTGAHLHVEGRWTDLDWSRGSSNHLVAFMQDNDAQASGLSFTLFGDYALFLYRYLDDHTPDYPGQYNGGEYSALSAVFDVYRSGTSFIMSCDASANEYDKSYSETLSNFNNPFKVRLDCQMDYWSNTISVNTYYNLVYLRKYVSPEPIQGSWGSEETSNNLPNAPTLSNPVAGYRYNPSASVTFSWTFSDPDAGDTQSAYQLQIGSSDFTIIYLDTGKVASTSSSTIRTLPSAVGLYYWRVKTWDNKDAEGPYSAGRIVIVDRIKTTACGILNNVVDTRTGGAVWYTAVYESDSTPFTSSVGTLYLNGTAMTWATDRWTYAFPYSMSGSQAVFHITSVAESTYGLTGLNNAAGNIVLNWATMEITINKP